MAVTTDNRLWWKNRELWMKKNDPHSYDYWKRILKPVLGRSMARTVDAIRALGARGYPHNPSPPIRAAIRRISKGMQRYETVNGSQITFDFLRSLALEHKRKLLKRRAAN